MHRYRRVTLLVACILVGCGADYKQTIEKQADRIAALQTSELMLARKVDVLSNELAKLQHQFDNDQAIEAARIQALDDSAAVYEACRLVINVCSESILAPGRKALEDGSNGGRSSRFWYLFMLKTITFAALFAGLLGVILEFFLGRYKPIFNAGKDARQWLEQAELKKKEATREIQRLETAKLEKMNELQKVNEQISDVQENLKDAQADYELETAILQHELDKLAEEQKRQAGITKAASVFNSFKDL